MSPDRVVSALTPRRQFLLAIGVFAGLSLVAIPYIGCSYGWPEAGGSALILSLPVLIAIRLYRRWNALQEHEIPFLLMVVIFATFGVVGLMGSWESVVALPREADRMNRQLHRDPAFQDVEASILHKSSLRLRGSVPTAADLARLESLVARSHTRWVMDVEVAVTR